MRFLLTIGLLQKRTTRAIMWLAMTYIALLVLLSFVPTPAQAHSTLRVTTADVVRVYDGDTFYVTFNGLPAVFGQEVSIRILGIDTPELRSRCSTDALKEMERTAARAARDRLSQLLNVSGVIEFPNLDGDSRDAFGRILTHVLINGNDVGAQLIGAGLAMPIEDSQYDWCDHFQNQLDISGDSL